MDLIIAFYCAFADRVRGGFPSDRFWLPAQKPWWKPPLRTFIWFTCGLILAWYMTHPSSFAQIAICIVASVLYALGERQNMGVIGWLYPTHPKQIWGWLQQLRIGALWSACVMPLYFLDVKLCISLILGCFFAPILGALFGRFINPQLPSYCFELNNQWAWTEFYRGFFMSIISIIVYNSALINNLI